MLDADLMFRPVGELADLVRRGEVASSELVELSVSRIEALDPQLDAFIDVDAERALADAAAVSPGDERPFAGVPIAIKNNRPAAGWRYTLACDLMGDFRPDFDHVVVRRLKAAGFVVVGTTNLPEYGIQPVSEPRRFPASRNPWDRERTPGGSSGGSGAAVAAGMVPIAHANDGGGSIRIPAACCGLVGLKPQRMRVPLGPEVGDHPLVQDGVLTRTVAETAQLLDLLEGPDTGDASWAPAPDGPYREAVDREPGTLRIGVAVNPPLPDATVDPLCLAAVDDAAALLEELGHEVERIQPSWTNPALLPLFSIEFMTAIATQIGFSALIAGREPRREDMQALSWAIFEQAKQLSALEFAGAHVQLQALMRGLIGELDAYDAILTPGLAQRPLPIGALDSDDDENPLAAFAQAGLFTPFTAGMNASGQPALTLPFAHGDDGLPTGIQLIGRPVQEDVLLSLGAQIERARPWHDRRAPIS
ncbi:MAG TPA: amidase [Capillimicrobium sp.]|jgi:amidase